MPEHRDPKPENVTPMPESNPNPSPLTPNRPCAACGSPNACNDVNWLPWCGAEECGRLAVMAAEILAKKTYAGSAWLKVSPPPGALPRTQLATLRAVAAGRIVFQSRPAARALVRLGYLAWKDPHGARDCGVAKLTAAGRQYLTARGYLVRGRKPLPSWARGKSGWYIDLGHVGMLQAFREPTGTWCYGFFGAAYFTCVRGNRDQVMIIAEDYAIKHVDAARAALRPKIDIDIDVAVPKVRRSR